MFTILLSRNSTRSSPVHSIAHALPSLATHTNSLTSRQLSGQALWPRYLKLRRALPSFGPSLRTYGYASCGYSCPVSLPHSKYYFLEESTPMRGAGCPIWTRGPALMRRTPRWLFALYQFYRNIYYSPLSLLLQIRRGRTCECSHEATKHDPSDGVGVVRARRHNAVQVLLQK